jgi:hypothetical protein
MADQSGSPERRAFDRRGFLQFLVGSLASVPAVAAAQTAPAPTTPAAAAPTAATPPAGPEHSGNEARLLTEVLRARYPERLSEAQWGSVVTDFDGDLGGAKRLRATKLKNSDEPDFTFRP